MSMRELGARQKAESPDVGRELDESAVEAFLDDWDAQIAEYKHSQKGLPIEEQISFTPDIRRALSAYESGRRNSPLRKYAEAMAKALTDLLCEVAGLQTADGENVTERPAAQQAIQVIRAYREARGKVGTDANNMRRHI